MKTFRSLASVLALFLVLTACKKDDDPVIAGYGPIANFSVSGGDCGAPCAVTFTNTSANSVAYTWDFGDGTALSSAATSSVVHTYEEPGIYTVTLTAKASNNTTSAKVLQVEIKEDAAGNMLTARNYLLVALEITVQGQTFDGMSFYPACQLDDTHKFNQDGTYIVTDAGMQCQPPTNASGTWEFNNNQTQLTITTQGFSQTYDVLQLSQDKLILEMPDSGMGGSVKFTYQAI